MLKCNRCKNTFEKADEEYEYHSEVDTRCYEKYYVCPICGSKDIDEIIGGSRNEEV